MREYFERYGSFDIVYHTEIDDYTIRGPYDGREKLADPPRFPTFREAVEFIDEYEREDLEKIKRSLLDSEKPLEEIDDYIES